MLVEWAARVGIGVVLAWAALPLLVKLARRSRSGPPTEYYRALLAALTIATALIFLPLIRTWSGSVMSLLAPGRSVTDASSVAFVAELMSPLISTAASAWPSVPWPAIFAAIGGMWLLLSAAGVSASIVGHLRLRRAYSSAPAAHARVIEHAELIAAELGIAMPAIRVVGGHLAAFTYGVISPVIVISKGACELPEDELDFVLRHELCHVARHDARAACFIDLAQRCLAGHPSLRALASEIRVAREACADEAAAGLQSLEYARLLLSIAERMESLHASSGSLVSIADTALERRVDMLINPDRSRSRRSMLWLALTGFCLCCLVFLAPASQGQSRAQAGDHPIVKGNLSVEQVESALFMNTQPMLSCYAELKEPRANLLVHLSFEIGEDGRVTRGRVSAPQHRAIEPCVHAALMQRSFPRPSSGRVSVEAPTLLTPPYDERRAVFAVRQGTSQSLSREVIRATIRNYLPQLRGCFERVGENLSSVSVEMRFVIGRDGTTIDGQTVDKSNPATETEAFNQLAQCIDDVRRTMQFPAPDNGILPVSYPLAFGHTP